MAFLLKRGFLTGFLPGFLFLTGVVVVWGEDYHVGYLLAFCTALSLPLAIGILVVSFIIGLVVDSIRDNFIEKWLKSRCRKDIDWDFFYDAPKDKIDILDDNYYIWYVVRLDLVISLVMIILSTLANVGVKLAKYGVCGVFDKEWIVGPILLIVLSIIMIIPLWADALELRHEIAEHTHKWRINGPTA